MWQSDSSFPALLRTATLSLNVLMTTSMTALAYVSTLVSETYGVKSVSSVPGRRQLYTIIYTAVRSVDIQSSTSFLSLSPQTFISRICLGCVADIPLPACSQFSGSFRRFLGRLIYHSIIVSAVALLILTPWAFAVSHLCQPGWFLRFIY